ncbi:MAG: hypothetical protein HUK15_06745 [Bacteroidales bacterium]|nr:hypothetical protein [Bacteroidales bacterium]
MAENDSTKNSKALPDGIERYIDTRDGNSYQIKNIGGSVWMCDNMRYEGDIALGTSSNLHKPMRYYPGGSADNVEQFGYLYNWEAAQKVCPSGWHLPTVSEWKALKNDIGGENVGSQMASNSKLWNNGSLVRSANFGKSGMGVLPAGSFNGKISNFNSFAYFWCADEYEYHKNYAYYRYIYYNYGGIMTNYSLKSDGYSVRCVKD